MTRDHRPSPSPRAHPIVLIAAVLLVLGQAVLPLIRAAHEASHWAGHASASTAAFTGSPSLARTIAGGCGHAGHACKAVPEDVAPTDSPSRPSAPDRTPSHDGCDTCVMLASIRHEAVLGDATAVALLGLSFDRTPIVDSDAVLAPGVDARRARGPPAA